MVLGPVSTQMVFEAYSCSDVVELAVKWMIDQVERYSGWKEGVLFGDWGLDVKKDRSLARCCLYASGEEEVLSRTASPVCAPQCPTSSPAKLSTMDHS